MTQFEYRQKPTNEELAEFAEDFSCQEIEQILVEIGIPYEGREVVDILSDICDRDLQCKFSGQPTTFEGSEIWNLLEQKHRKVLTSIFLDFQQERSDIFVQVVDQHGNVMYSDPIRYGLENNPDAMAVIAASQHFYVPLFLDFHLREALLAVETTEDARQDGIHILNLTAQQQPVAWTRATIKFLQTKDPEYYNWLKENINLEGII